jgi:hypothetical protein
LRAVAISLLTYPAYNFDRGEYGEYHARWLRLEMVLRVTRANSITALPWSAVGGPFA